jgi:transitional endoplasmic reticulum ATPase
MLQSLLLHKYLVNGCFISIFLNKVLVTVTVERVTPRAWGIVDANTVFTFDCSHRGDDPGDASSRNCVDSLDELTVPLYVPTRQDVVTMDGHVQTIKDMVLLLARYGKSLAQKGITIPKGILIHGPPGVGKSALVKRALYECSLDVPCLCMQVLHGGSMATSASSLGEIEIQLREIFNKAEKHCAAPQQGILQNTSVIFLDDIDRLCEGRSEDSSSSEVRRVSQLLTLLDGLNDRGNIVIVAATHRPNSLDSALRRPGRLEREISILPPTLEERYEILHLYLHKYMSSSTTAAVARYASADVAAPDLAVDLDLSEIAFKTVGFVGRDLEILVRFAVGNMHLRQSDSSNTMTKLATVDFDAAFQAVEPSCLRGAIIHAKPVTWKDIGGLRDVKKKLRQAVEWPMKFANTFTKLGLDPPRGILLYGPPGCSKTTLACAVANLAGASFLSYSGTKDEDATLDAVLDSFLAIFVLRFHLP